MRDFLIAALLLATPAEAPREAFDALRAPLVMLALDWELLDPRETRFVLMNASEFDTDLKMLQRRYVDLHDASRVSASVGLPDRTMVNELLVFNRAYKRVLEARMSIDHLHDEEYRCVLNETEKLYGIWDSVRDATCDYYYVTVRRQALKRLDALVGDGPLPPHVPLWRFVEIR